LYVTWKLLQLRAANEQLFAHGAYYPLQVEGEYKDHVFAFARVHEGRGAIVVLPRWTARLMRGETTLPLGNVWGDTKVVIGSTLSGTFEEALSVPPVTVAPVGEERALQVAQLFAKFPLSVLRSTTS
jgi:(1->4)-alpha-D-glucan 1-alpha-D-glucosylmutase